tara:strand:- start:416 stop:910 length:495 start_codon:yes stop_codon:yes gene_type:complete
MPIEIERKFLIDNKGWEAKIIKTYLIKQAYFKTNDEWNIRVRFSENKSCITLKKNIKSSINYEFEYPIPIQEAKQIFELVPNRIEKDRHEIRANNQDWIVDCFHKKNNSLIIAEIELQKEDQSFIKPNFIGKEITDIKKLSNSSLAFYPISEWCEEDLKNIMRS